MFEIGSTYTRKEINAQLGGSTRACLLQSKGSVVGICYVPQMNPQAPRAIVVGHSPQKEKAAQQLAGQPTAVPVFAKKAANVYEHLGSFKGESYAAGVLLLAPAATEAQ